CNGCNFDHAQETRREVTFNVFPVGAGFSFRPGLRCHAISPSASEMLRAGVRLYRTREQNENTGFTESFLSAKRSSAFATGEHGILQSLIRSRAYARQTSTDFPLYHDLRKRAGVHARVPAPGMPCAPAD